MICCVYMTVCVVCVCVGVYVCMWGNLFFNLILFLSSKVCSTARLRLI